MRTNVEIDDALMARALKLSGLPQRETIEEGLRLVIELRRQAEVLELCGKFKVNREAVKDGHRQRGSR